MAILSKEIVFMPKPYPSEFRRPGYALDRQTSSSRTDSPSGSSRTNRLQGTLNRGYAKAPPARSAASPAWMSRTSCRWPQTPVLGPDDGDPTAMATAILREIIWPAR